MTPEQTAERARRIKLAVWACAYECYNTSFVDDYKFDSEARKVNVFQDTGDAALDAWFEENFDPSTGMWVHNHPGIRRLENIVEGILEARNEHQIGSEEISIGAL